MTKSTGQRDLPKPKRDEIVADLVDDIYAGRYRPGSRLPSEVELASDYEVSRDTAGQALNTLGRQGLAFRGAARNQGWYVMKPIPAKGPQAGRDGG